MRPLHTTGNRSARKEAQIGRKAQRRFFKIEGVLRVEVTLRLRSGQGGASLEDIFVELTKEA